MKALIGGRWQAGYLDEHRRPGSSRVRVLAQRDLGPVDGLHFVPARSPRMVLDYVGEVGLAGAARKVRSRLAEQGRNEKHLSAGVAEVLESDDFPAGSLVTFVAPCHPPAVERLSLPAGLLRPLAEAVELPAGSLTLLPAAPVDAGAPKAVDALGGWHPDSGVPHEELAWATDVLLGLAADTRWEHGRRLDVTPEEAPRERAERGRAPDGRPAAVLFGYGNYAKTYVLPGVRGAFDVAEIHEIDPFQIGPSPPGRTAWDTAPVSRGGPHDAWLVAGFHHTHAPLAVEGLAAGAAVVLEKPLATSHEDLEALLGALGRPGARLFGCFQRRYSAFTARALDDLGGPDAGPISYHCIVHEVPLPARHWYRWPSSRSRLVSNGCHWVDHFLFLNGYADVAERRVFEASDGTIVCALELVTGAAFSMTLTERGSSRTGVQDHVELRTPDRTVRIVDDAHYAAESTAGRIRRLRQPRTRSYERMYRRIAERIALGEDGDDVAIVRASAGEVLAMEDELIASRAARRH
jgi:predicted dehydrogenase